MLTAVLLAGCGDDAASTDGPPSGNDTGGETADDTSDDDTTSDDDSSDTEDADEAGDASGGDGDGASSDSGGAEENVETFEITVVDGEVSPPFDTYQVAPGADVRIEITSDTADELHLHGYDLELALEPGETGVMEFTADIEGRFELETHDLGLQLLQLEVG